MQDLICFPDQKLTPEIPPTWAEGSSVYHVIARCARLKAIAAPRRVTSTIPPRAMRQCLNCENIVRTARRG